MMPRPMSGTLWKSPASAELPPPPGPYRPSSAMNALPVARSNSRAASELGLGNNYIFKKKFLNFFFHQQLYNTKDGKY